MDIRCVSSSSQVLKISLQSVLARKMLAFSTVAVLLALAVSRAEGACTATINSLNDVAGAKSCSTVNINGFTVPAGKGFELSLADNAVVNLSA